MRPIQPLVRPPHSHIDSDWLSTIECASRTLRKFYEWATDHILGVTGSLPGSSLCLPISGHANMWSGSGRALVIYPSVRGNPELAKPTEI